MTQIKLKPGKPTEPGGYLCLKRNAVYPEFAIIRPNLRGGLDILMGISCFPLRRLEDDTLFSERIYLVIEGGNE